MRRGAAIQLSGVTVIVAVSGDVCHVITERRTLTRQPAS